MRQLADYFLVFILLASLLIMALVSVAMIPKEWIEDNIKESAEYLQERNIAFRWVFPGVEGSRLDLYADSMTLDIAYYLDTDHPVQSTMWAKYYWEPGTKINASFLKAVTENPEPNKEYVRYWHGSLVFIRPLLCCFSIQEIFILHAGILAALFLSLIALLWRYHFKAETACLTISLFMVNIVFVPFCLEYYWMFLLMFLTAILVIRLTLERKTEKLPILFLIVGMTAAFLDFFTTETITLLMPLLLSVRIQEKNGEVVPWKKAVLCCVSWMMGYVGMWSLKWGLASLVLGENMMPYVTGSIQEHLGSVDELPVITVIWQGLQRNILSLFPFNYGLVGAIVFFAAALIVMLMVMQNRMTMRQRVDRSWVRLYLLLGSIPFIRFVVIRHHSWFHYFFTHRALASSILSLCFIVLELVQLNLRKAVMKNA